MILLSLFVFAERVGDSRERGLELNELKGVNLKRFGLVAARDQGLSQSGSLLTAKGRDCHSKLSRVILRMLAPSRWDLRQVGEVLMK